MASSWSSRRRSLKPGLDLPVWTRQLRTLPSRRRSSRHVHGLRRGELRRKPLQRKGMRRLLNGEDFSCCAEINGFAKDSSRSDPTKREVMPFLGVTPLAVRQCPVVSSSIGHRRNAAQIPHLSGTSAAGSTAKTAIANTGCSWAS